MTNDDVLAPVGSPPAPPVTAAPSHITAPPKLTERQWMILDFIRASTRHLGYPPTLREIGHAAGLSSTSSVSHHIERLEQMNVIAREPGRPRAYRVIVGDRATQPIPAVNLVGCPLLETRNDGDHTEPAQVLKIAIDPALKHALLAGAYLTVQHLPVADPDGTTFTNAVYGHVTAVTHLLGSPHL
ncbi:LexA family protein [Streptomyces chartreusis]|uniref:LexA family protein n=1 Tax=Streptomyces chartreusis TaxID=1969 RepID=UPI00367AD7E6